MGDIVGRSIIEVGRAISHEELAIKDVEGHIAEWQQLKQQHREENDRHAPERCARALRNVVECQPCTSQYSPPLPQQDQLKCTHHGQHRQPYVMSQLPTLACRIKGTGFVINHLSPVAWEDRCMRRTG